MTSEKEISLEHQLAEMRDGAAARNPWIWQILQEDNARRLAEGLREQALHEGQVAPDFSLPDSIGKRIELSQLLSLGPVVLTFYRGEWCPYCNLTLRGYQKVLTQIQALGANLVAVSPQTPDHSLSMTEKNNLEFAVLSDAYNQVSRQYGLIFKVNPEIQKSMQNRGTELAAYNGDESWELPVPGTFVIGRDGIVTLSFVDPDYTRRLEPERILEALQKLDA